MDFSLRLRAFNKDLRKLLFTKPAFVYNPLEYASDVVLEYWDRFACGPKEVVFLGMNPGPWGMVQTGVPFGEVAAARDWMKLTGKVQKPRQEHPARPILGWDCRRSEVSGRRFWGWIQKLHPNPDDFFKTRVVHNFCPLAFLESSGRNLTPDKLPANERLPLEQLCQEFLSELIHYWKPQWLIGVGQFAEDRLKELQLPNMEVTRIAHPSPANPKANKDWEGTITAELKETGVLEEIVKISPNR